MTHSLHQKRNTYPIHPWAAKLLSLLFGVVRGNLDVIVEDYNLLMAETTVT
jgi:hypothetical protein